MRIGIATVQVPFVHGGAELLASGLCEQLEKRGYEADVISMPFKWYPPQNIDLNLMYWRSLDLTESDGVPLDLLICLKFPTWMVRHPAKVVWLLHQHRDAYDLWGRPNGDLHKWPVGEEMRDRIMRADSIGLREARGIFTISSVVSKRLMSYNGIDSEPLLHPSPLSGRFGETHRGTGNYYIFAPGRLNRSKRLDCAIRALAKARNRKLRLVITGTGSEGQRLQDEAVRTGVQSRVDFFGRVPAERLIDLYVGAQAVYYGPYDEDYGYVTWEAMEAGKPVITFRDSGAPAEYVQHGVTGWILGSEFELAQAMDEAADLEVSTRMGSHARAWVKAQHVSWDNVIARLLE